MHVHLVRVQLQALQDNLVADRFDDLQPGSAKAVLGGQTRRAELAARHHVRNTAALAQADDWLRGEQPLGSRE